MRIALFQNFTAKPFTGFWNGRPYTFKPGQKKYMQEFLARHFAKHLANQVLAEKGGDFVNYTSPKKPESVPHFMELFNKAFVLQEEEGSDGDGMDETEVGMNLANAQMTTEPSMNMPESKQPIQKGPGRDAQVIKAPDADLDDEENFEGNQEEEK